MPGRALGRLLRLSLLPSAVADVASGILFAAGWWPSGSAPWLLILASLCVYHGGMALNDWADRAEDARLRPDRPLPAGAIPAGAAGALGFGLLVLGPCLALFAGRAPAFVLTGVAVLAALYDLVGRGPWLGPLLLALCRAGNLGAGIALGRAAGSTAPGTPELLVLLGAPVAYGLYVLVVSRLGRLEDVEPGTSLGRRPARLIAVAAALLLTVPVLPQPELASAGWAFLERQRLTLAALISAAGSFGLLRLAFRHGTWTPALVLPAMGMALRRLLIFTSALAMARGTPHAFWAALLILGGYPISYGLRRLFPPS